jgi:predicted S18 family serine protease
MTIMHAPPKEVCMARLISALILVLLIAVPSLAQQSLVGTYKLVSVQREIDGKADPLPGNPPRGY